MLQVRVIDSEFLDVIRRQALVGEARVTAAHPDIFAAPLALDMAVDIMFDRGFALRVDEYPVGTFRFKITFPPPKLHNVASEKLTKAPR